MLTVEDIHGDYSWKWELLSFDLPESLKDKIKAIPIQNYGLREDTIMWKHTLDGEFSTKSAYHLAIKGENSSPVFKGAWIWKLDILPKITTFLWLCLHNSIPVREVLASRGITCESLRELIEGPLKQEDNMLTVEDIHGDYSWKWELLSFDLPESLKDKIKAIPIQNYGLREDTIMWKHTLDGEFSTKSAYHLAIKGENSSPVFKGAWIWKLDILPKITTFLWLCLHNSIPVREVLASRGITCIQQLEVELDAKVIVDLLKSNKKPNTAYSPLLSDWRLLLAMVPQARVAHVFREANKCADLLAKKGCSLLDDFVQFDSPPSSYFESVLAMDYNGLYVFRFLNANVASVLN
nr:hypothetical protein CFP56_18229 [Quercus suber]